MQRRKMLIAVAIVASLLIGSVSAYLLTYYGYIQTTANVGQLVLLDGHDYTIPATHSFDAYGGDEFRFAHWLKNQGHVDVDINQTTVGADGIPVEFYKPETLTLIASDFAYRDSAVQYVSSVVVSWADGCAVWTIDLNGSLISGHWSTGAQLLITKTDVTFTFGISPGASQPVYKEYIGGAWVQKDVPTDMVAEGSVNGEHFVLKIPIGYLQCFEAFWAINIEASWAGHSGSYYAQYPTNWGRWNNPTAGVAAFPTTTLTFPYKLKAGERLDFIICYKFLMLIGPGTYTITTYFKPS